MPILYTQIIFYKDFLQNSKGGKIKMRNTKVKNKIINILGELKNAVLIGVVMFSLLILFSDIIYNNILLTLILKLVAIINIYCFISVNSDHIINK